jgi:hypothetical protein
MVDLSNDTDVTLNAAQCSGFDSLPPLEGVVGDTGCPAGGDICYSQSTPASLIPDGACAIIAIP